MGDVQKPDQTITVSNAELNDLSHRLGACAMVLHNSCRSLTDAMLEAVSNIQNLVSRIDELAVVNDEEHQIEESDDGSNCVVIQKWQAAEAANTILREYLDGTH